MFQGVVRAGHGESFRGRCDAVAGAEGQHRVRGRGTTERRAGERFLAANHRKGGHRHRRRHGADGVQAALGF